MYFEAASCLALGCAMLISPSQAQRPDVATNRAESDNGALRVEPVTTVIAVGVVTALATDMIKQLLAKREDEASKGADVDAGCSKECTVLCRSAAKAKCSSEAGAAGG